MKNFKGTPGPWQKVIDKQRHITVRAGKKYPNRDLYELNVKLGTIYEDDCGNPQCCNSEEHANATLIASAPDLLEVMIKTREWLVKSGLVNHENADQYNLIDNAIKKALGHL